ncbi:prostaglandin E2 receptor EP4 subtype-like [Dendronephthya gigantea]|uniref:prostaglandin E2 receptor EP4 subtype-like n=1 Tax=Dendronephthya gigantea TaxID=151771 RepID=UPI00106B9920|nr:prostaglandin E2 receptor EP4 subtype-like [Dendronephthya gigantea]
MCVSSFEIPPEPSSGLKLILGISFLLTVVIGFLGNVVSIAILAKVLRSRQTVPNALIFILACVDLLTIILGFGPALLNYLSGLSIAHAPLCNFQGATLNFLYLMSITLVTCLSFDRYLALFTPFFYKANSVFNCKKLSFTLLLFCCFAMIISLLPSFGAGRRVLQYPGTFCTIELNPKDLGGKITLNTNLAFLLFCTMIIVLCNAAVSWKSFQMLNRSRERQPSVDNEEMGSILSVCTTDECQFLKLSMIVMTLFLLCWTLFMVSYPQASRANIAVLCRLR